MSNRNESADWPKQILDEAYELFDRAWYATGKSDSYDNTYTQAEDALFDCVETRLYERKTNLPSSQPQSQESRTDESLASGSREG